MDLFFLGIPLKIGEQIVYLLAPYLVALALIAMITEISFISVHRKLFYAMSGGAFTGFFMAAFWLTREEGIWLVPSIIVVVAISLYVTVRDGREQGGSLGAALI